MNRQNKLILQILIKSTQPVTGAELAAQAGCCQRSIRTYIKVLQSEIAVFGAQLKSAPHRGYSLIADESVLEKLRQNFLHNMLLDSEVIVARLLEHLVKNILTDKWIIQLDLAEELYISLSTLKQHLKTIKTLLRNYDLQLTSSAKGIAVKGSEKQLRYFLFEYFHDKSESAKIMTFLLHEFDLLLLDEIIQGSLQKRAVKLTDKAIKDIRLHLIIAVRRSLTHHDIFYTIGETKDFYDRIEHSIAKDILFSLYQKMSINTSVNDLYYITQHLIAGKKFLLPPSPMSKKYIEKIVRQIFKKLKEDFAIDFITDEYLADGLTLHLQVALSRIKFHMQIKNELLENIKTEYPLAFRLAIVACGVINQIENITAGEDEIGYIAIHFAAALSRKGIRQSKAQKKIIIACASGLGIAILLRSRLEERFGHSIKINDILPGYDIDTNLLKEIDYVITTEPLPHINSEKIIYLRNLCNADDLQLIEERMFQTDIIQSMYLDTLFRAEWFLTAHLPDKQAVLQFLTENLKKTGYMTDKTQASVFEREQISSTEIGNLVALPHPLINNQKKSVIAILILDKPIQWEENMVQIVFLISIEKPLLHLWNTVAVKLYDYLVKNNGVKSLLRERSFTNFFDGFIKMFT